MIPVAPGFFKPQLNNGYPCGLTPVLWFDASDNNTLSVVSGNVDSITCKITSETWSAPSSVNRPPLTTIADFNLQCLDFYNDGNNKYVTGTAINVPVPCTIFLVAYWENLSGYKGVGLFSNNATNSIQNGTGQPSAFLYSNTTTSLNRGLQFRSNNTFNATVTTIPSGVNAVFCIDVPSTTTPSDCKLYWNDNVITDTNNTGTFASNSPFITLGCTDTLYLSKGYIGEVVAYGTSLSANDRACITNYLYNKWIA